MKKFNIYYGYQKLNHSPLSEKEKDLIFENKFIWKDNGNGKKEKILTKDLKIMKCIVI